MAMGRRAQGEQEWAIATGYRVGAPEARRARLAAVLRYLQRVNEQVEARLAGGEVAAVAYPEALREELERLRHATD